MESIERYECHNCKHNKLRDDYKYTLVSSIHEKQKKQINQLNDEIYERDVEIEAWKCASGLSIGGDAGDPDTVTPNDAQKYWEMIEKENEKLKDRINKLEWSLELVDPNNDLLNE